MVENVRERTGDQTELQATTSPAHAETTDETAPLALSMLDGMMAAVTYLAEQTKRGSIQFHASRLRDAVQRALAGAPEAEGHTDPPVGAAPESNGRDSRLLAWARGTPYDARDPFDVQGRMISANRTWAEDVMDAEAAAQTQGLDKLSRETRNTAAYRVLKGLARAFDPQEHGTDFRAYAEPFLRGAARRCLATGKCSVPNTTDGNELQELLAEPVHPEAAPTTPRQRPVDPTRVERNARLCEWTRRHGFLGQNTFHRQGTMINAYIGNMREVATGMSGAMGTLENSTLQTAGYRTLKGLVVLFDPFLHGDDFWAWAEPYVRAAMQCCNHAGRMVIPDTPDAAFLEELLAGTSPAETALDQNTDTPPHESNSAEPADPTHSVTDDHSAAPSHLAEGEGDDRNTTDAATAPPATNPPLSDTPVDPPAAGTPADAPQDPPADPSEDPPPDPEPHVHPSTAEEIAEQKRQRRFCRFARDALGIEVGQEDFAGAVEGVCGKLENLVGSIVSAMQLPGKFRGGKTAVRKEGTHLLPDIVVRYDPPNIPDAGEAKGRFITHMKQRLAPQLEAFVKQ